MKEIFRKFQQEAIRIADRYPVPAFYIDFKDAVGRSRQFFDSDPVIDRLHSYVKGVIENDFGHGLEHVREVALDAGALILIEQDIPEHPEPGQCQGLRMAHCAGLLHDIRRKVRNHAEAGAEAADGILRAYPFTDAEVGHICRAIRNHEAFGENRTEGCCGAGALLSDCLYDADKFRWGPENFTRTVWGMISSMDVSVETFMDHYPRGMAFLQKIRSTFRTRTGKLYGPQFIDLGLAIGNDLYEVIRTEVRGVIDSP